ncbi:MAG: SRPBCC family protein [Rudaea sp.]
MARITRTIMIHAPVEKVFAFAGDAARLVEWWPSMQEVRNVQPLPGGGQCFDWTYRMAGIPVNGSGKHVEWIPNQLLVTENRGGIPSRFVWNFQSLGDETRLTMQTEYKLVGALARLAEPMVVRLNEHETDIILANLKAQMEKGE